MEYNQYLIYNTYRIAIIEVLKNKFNVSSLFKKEIEKEFNNNKSKLTNDLLSYKQIFGNSTVESRIYFMKKTKLNFISLIEEFNLIV
jgi:hypothetical protein